MSPLMERLIRPRVHGRYFYSRQAYYPRFWPMALVISSTVVPFCILADVFVAHGGLWPWVWAIVSATLGLTVVNIRLFLWRRKHPILPPERTVQSLRDAAPWN